jgi:hypothetical protein
MNFGASLRGASARFLSIATASALVYSAAAHEEVTVAITMAGCARLVEHVPAPDVAYQPGVDVHGREVVPADLNGAPRIQLPEMILIPIEVDLLERFGIPANPALFDADAHVGEVAYRDGRFTFNGQPLQDEAAAELAARCQKIIRDQQ